MYFGVGRDEKQNSVGSGGARAIPISQGALGPQQPKGHRCSLICLRQKGIEVFIGCDARKAGNTRLTCIPSGQLLRFECGKWDELMQSLELAA